MTRVRLDHDPNSDVVEVEEAQIIDMERMGFSVTRMDGSKSKASVQPKPSARNQNQEG